MTAPSPNAREPGANLLATWPQQTQWVLALILFLSLTFVAGHVLLGNLNDDRPTALERQAFPTALVNLNEADRATLRQLPDVGEDVAKRIEEYRARVGGFRSVDELENVSGIGRVRLARLRTWVYVDEPDDEERPTVAPPVRKSRSTTKKDRLLSEPVDVNSAGLDQLQKVNGIGPVLAAQIVATRNKKPFESVDDLRRVSGIGAKVLEKIRPNVVVRK